jgi:hypothetical protein
VTVVTTAKGTTEVVACSLFRGKPMLTCGKPCMKPATA